MSESKQVYIVKYNGKLVGKVSAHSQWEAVEIVLYSYDVKYEHNIDRAKFNVKKLCYV
jgi:hypothetical protein